MKPPSRVYAITVGAGRDRKQGRRLDLGSDGDIVRAFIGALSSQPTQVDGWWTPHLWQNNSRATGTKWLQACAISIDVDCKMIREALDAQGKPQLDKSGARTREKQKAGLPPAWIEQLERAAGGKLPGSFFHPTPHGLRIGFVLDEPQTDSACWKQATRGAIALVKAAIQQLGFPAPSLGAPGLLVDEPPTLDRKRIFFRPRATVDGIARDAAIVPLRQIPYSVAELLVHAPAAATTPSNSASTIEQQAEVDDESPRTPIDEIDIPVTHGHRPGDRFNQGASWNEILGPHGWILLSTDANGVETWQRPGKSEYPGASATVGHCRDRDGNPLLHVFSSNAPPFEANGTYSRFAAFTLLNHGGDFKTSTRAIIALGYGDRASTEDDAARIEARITRAFETVRELRDAEQQRVEASKEEAKPLFPEQTLDVMLANSRVFSRIWNGSAEDLDVEDPAERRDKNVKSLITLSVKLNHSPKNLIALLVDFGSKHRFDFLDAYTPAMVTEWILGALVRPKSKGAKNRTRPSRDDSPSEPPSDSSGQATPAFSTGRPLTDLGNAERLVDLHGRDLHFCSALKWLVFDGTRWKADATDEVLRRAELTVRSIYAEASAAPDKTSRGDLAEWAKRSESRRRIEDTVRLAEHQSGISIDVDKFDRDPLVLNCLNGTIDLKSGVLREHRREDLITKLAPVSYDPAAALPLWDTFIEKVLPDPDLRLFVQRAAGYTMTGLTSEECVFFAYGDTATGKSTFFDAVRSVLGDYGATADIATFTEARQRGGEARDDVASLAGRRFVATIEVGHGARLAEGLVKTLTGGDPVRARHLYSRGFEFVPQFKIWIAANHQPRVRDDDDAIWRRIRVVPFEVQIPKMARDPKVKATLRDPKVAGPAVLRWLVEGCVQWQKTGLGEPRAVSVATEAYRADMDPLRDFIESRCVLEAHAWESSASLRASYEKWCGANGVATPITERAFADRLKARGLSPEKQGGDRGWRGIRLVAAVDASGHIGNDDPTSSIAANDAAVDASGRLGRQSAELSHTRAREGKLRQVPSEASGPVQTRAHRGSSASSPDPSQPSTAVHESPAASTPTIATGPETSDLSETPDLPSPPTNGVEQRAPDSVLRDAEEVFEP